MRESRNNGEQVVGLGLVDTIQALISDSATPAGAVPVLEQTIDPDSLTHDLHLLRATGQLVRVIMEQTGPANIVIWVADEEQLTDWARSALQRVLLNGQGFEKNRLISEVVTVERLVTAKLGFPRRLTEAFDELHGTTLRRRLGQGRSTPLAGARRRQRRTSSMVHGKNRIPYRIDRRLTGLAGPEYHAIISFGLPIESEDSQDGEYRMI